MESNFHELGGTGRRPLLACLLPVRNGERDLPGYLESAGHFADTVIALEDGSTDSTREILESSPLVSKVLHNPRRDGYAGWDDAANRQRLLDAAAESVSGWALFLDADERIDADDGAVLREFLEADALPACAYGLQLHRMWGDSCAPGLTYVYRIFAPRSGQRLPTRRLHFNPIPDEISGRAWVRTTVRVRHLDSPDRLRERLAKYEHADQERAFERRPARLLREPGSPLVPWAERRPGLPALDPALTWTSADTTRTTSPYGPPQPGVTKTARPLLACLLPVRNGERDLPGYLESAGHFADTVIALEDGSTDSTREILESSPLVSKVLHNPRRDGYAGWDDAANRQRLLDAAAESDPAWIMWLDVDERIDPDDALALRAFVEHDADPIRAYGFRVFRMIGENSRYDRADFWAYRLFAAAPDRQLPADRLHAVPIPLSIPRAKWRRTTIRIQHLASLDADRREARYRKYEQADPERRYQRDYSRLLEPESALKPWVPRPSGFPLLADPLGHGQSAELDLAALDASAIAVSAIVISRDDERTIECSVRRVVEQECHLPFEVIVVVSGTDRTAEVVAEKFPEVKLVRLPGPALPGEARNAGLAVACGEFISFPGSHVEIAPGSLAARLRAHQRGYAMVTGSTLNGTLSHSGWASYFLDHSASTPGRPSGQLTSPPAHCSYSRQALLDLGGFPEHLRAGEDTVVNRELWGRGYRAYRESEIQFTHVTRCTTPMRLMRHHFTRGRAFGRILCEQHETGPRLLRREAVQVHLVEHVPRRLRLIRENVDRWGAEVKGEYRSVRHLIVAASISAWLGLWWEVLRPGSGKGAILMRNGPNGSLDADAAPEGLPTLTFFSGREGEGQTGRRGSSWTQRR